MVSTIAEFARRPKRAFESDGLLDIAIGVCLLGIAMMGWASIASIATMHGADFTRSAAYRNGNILVILSNVAANVIIVGSFFAVGVAKKRLVYPRVGYFAPRAASTVNHARFTLFAASGIIVGGVAAYLSRLLVTTSHVDPATSSSETAVACVGIAAALGLVVQYARLRFARHLVVAAVALLASLALAAAHADWLHGSAYLEVILGASMIVSGAIPLAALLRLPVATDAERNGE